MHRSLTLSHSKPDRTRSGFLQVIRYTALFSGVAYGWYYRRSLQASHDKHQLEDAAHHREKLIAEAKAAWKRKHEPQDSTREFS